MGKNNIVACTVHSHIIDDRTVTYKVMYKNKDDGLVYDRLLFTKLQCVLKNGVGIHLEYFVCIMVGAVLQLKIKLAIVSVERMK